MNSLTCHVTNCANNSDSCCCLTSIDVSGQNACTSEETVCSSYVPRNGANNCSYHNSPNVRPQISCNACNCVYNDNKKCMSDSVSIDCDCGSSECKTFKE